jgi:hypothetical protein
MTGRYGPPDLFPEEEIEPDHFAPMTPADGAAGRTAAAYAEGEPE